MLRHGRHFSDARIISLLQWLELIRTLVVRCIDLIFSLINNFFNFIDVEPVNWVESYCWNWSVYSFLHINCLKFLIFHHLQILCRNQSLRDGNECVAFLSYLNELQFARILMETVIAYDEKLVMRKGRWLVSWISCCGLRCYFGRDSFWVSFSSKVHTIKCVDWSHVRQCDGEVEFDGTWLIIVKGWLLKLGRV